MPAETDAAHEPDNFGDLPMQPTGSGVADLETAYERMQVADDEVATASVDAGIADETAAYDAAATPTEGGADAADSAAHPS